MDRSDSRFADRIAAALGVCAALWLFAALGGPTWAVFAAGAATVAMPPLLMALGERRGRRAAFWPPAVWMQLAHAATWLPSGPVEAWWGGLPAPTWAMLLGLWLVPLIWFGLLYAWRRSEDER